MILAPRTLGRWCRQNRMRLDLTQADLSRETGIDPAHLSRIENNHGQPTWKIRKKLHAVFGTSDKDLARLGIVTYDPLMEDDGE